LTWELDVWGRIDLQNQAAQANALASQEDLALARLSAQATLVQTYIALRTAERQYAVVEKAQAAYERALTLTRYRYEAGVVSAADVAQAESRLSGAKSSVIAAEGNLRSAIATFERVVGFKPETQLASPEKLPQLPATLDEALGMGRSKGKEEFSWGPIVEKGIDAAGLLLQSHLAGGPPATNAVPPFVARGVAAVPAPPASLPAEAPAAPVRTALDNAAADLGFVIERSTIEALGLCPACHLAAA
jgi:tetratricopeptide (TPR) repeat protein